MNTKAENNEETTRQDVRSTGLVSSERILQEVEFALAPDKPVGFMAIVLSESKPLEMVVPTIIEIGAPKELTKYKQREIRDKMHELGELLKEVYC